MTAFEVGQKLVALCKQGKQDEVIATLYSADIVSIEAAAAPGMPAEMRGLDAIKAKGKWWYENHEIHGAKAEGPFPNGDRFIVKFWFDVTQKESELVVTGQSAPNEGEKEYLYRGIAGRNFERHFQLADHVKVVGAKLANGLLTIELQREIPEEKKPRAIPVVAGQAALTH